MWSISIFQPVLPQIMNSISSAICPHRLELEDMEMKHNSALKQLMREFNTQMALRETELDAAVKEAIGEAGGIRCAFMRGN